MSTTSKPPLYVAVATGRGQASECVSPLSPTYSKDKSSTIVTETEKIHIEKSLSQTSSFDGSRPSSSEKTGFTRKWLARTNDLLPSTSPEEAVKLVSWGIHWYTPVSIILLLLLSLGSSIAHHGYYKILHDTPAGDASEQEWVARIGTALSFLSGTAMKAVVAIARRQWLWVTLRKRSMTLGGIDAMFGAESDPWYFLNVDMLLHAKMSTLMALVIWAIPLTAILTSGTITVIPTSHTATVNCTVPTIKFDYDNDPISKVAPYGANFFNLGGTLDGYYWRPGLRARSAFTISAFSGHVATPNNGTGLYNAQVARLYNQNTTQSTTLANLKSFEESCGAECTYDIKFRGPAVKCTEKTPWNKTEAPWADKNMFANVTVFHAERAENTSNVLWVGYIAGETVNWGDPKAVARVKPHVYSCQNSVARYKVRMDVQNSRFREPTILEVDYLYELDAEPLTDPEGRFLPNFSLFDILVEILEGDISGRPSGPEDEMPGQWHRLVNQTKIGSTPLSSAVYELVPEMGSAIEVMTQKMAVSLLSADSPVVKKFPPALMRYAAQTTTSCTSTIYLNVYHYTLWRLVSTYIIAMVITLGMAELGFVALHKNGVASGSSFSNILLTTRNQSLDELMAGNSLGTDPLHKDIENLKLRFGVIDPKGGDDPNGIRHVAMGLEGEVSQIKKGGRYS